jgi:hypothetical protein
MPENLELDGLNELRAALVEERLNIVTAVRKLRDTRRQKGSFVLGDGAASGDRFAVVQRQIEVVEARIAAMMREVG